MLPAMRKPNARLTRTIDPSCGTIARARRSRTGLWIRVPASSTPMRPKIAPDAPTLLPGRDDEAGGRGRGRGQDVEDGKGPRPPDPFDERAEQIEGVHVERQVEQVRRGRASRTGGGTGSPRARSDLSSSSARRNGSPSADRAMNDVTTVNPRITYDERQRRAGAPAPGEVAPRRRRRRRSPSPASPAVPRSPPCPRPGARRSASR